MTGKELKNKCKERAKIFQQAMESCKSSNPMYCIEWFADRIEELEKENAELKKCSTKAKKILKTIADNWQGSRVNTDKNRMIHKAFNDAEMFFKEMKEK